MGIGIGEGANRAVDAARQAINNPLLENANIDGAKSVLVNLTAGDGLMLSEYQDVVELITENCDEDALIIAGQAYDADMGDKVKVTVVATGFKQEPVSVEVPEFEKPRKRFDQFIGSQNQQGQSQAAKTDAPAEEKGTEQVISVNRWQDLQQQIGKRQGSNGTGLPDDYSFPAILRYKRDEDK